jgi:glycine/D-amino acid oxidase-like deaminating enzyme
VAPVSLSVRLRVDGRPVFRNAPVTPQASSLPEAELASVETDVVIVGGGIAGTCAAYHLAASGVRVMLLERDVVGGGATGTAVGVLLPPLFQPFHETVRFRGTRVAQNVWRFALRSVAGLADLLESRGAVAATGLDRTGGYVLADGESLTEVERACRALESAGLPVDWLSRDRVHEIAGGGGFLGGYRIEGGGCVSPMPTVRAVADAAREAGAVILEATGVDDVHRREGRLACDTNHGRILAEMVIYATHVDARRFSAFVGDEIVPIRGQAMMVESGAPTFKGGFSTHWKLNVWRSDPEGRLIMGGWRSDAWDRSYWKATPRLDEELQDSLEGWFRSTLSGMGGYAIGRRWSGIYGWTADYLPLVGPLPGRPGELILSGFSGGGLSLAFEAGRAVAAMVTDGEPVPGTRLFNPRRFT